MKTLFNKSKVKWQKSKDKLILIYFLVFIYAFPTSIAQIYSEADIEICDQKFQLSVKEDLKDKPINDVLVDIGKSFIGTDYLAYGLEADGDEQLVVNLTGLDCTTFTENSLALARCVKKDETSFDDYLEELQFIRYRNGIIDGYPSRLHYFSDWITNNTSKGVVQDETKKLGGIPIKFKLDFMSTHPESYEQLKENPELIPIIKNY